MRIRKATKKDKGSISELYYKLHPIEEKENKEKGLLVPIEKSIIKPVLLIAEEKGKIIGFIWAHFIQYGFFKYGTLDELFVEKRFRSQGIGRKLVEEAVRRLQRMKTKMILVGTEKKNKKAVRLYRKVGFKLGKNSLWFYWIPEKENKSK